MGFFPGFSLLELAGAISFGSDVVRHPRHRFNSVASFSTSSASRVGFVKLGLGVGSRLARVGSWWVSGLFRASLRVAALQVLGWLSAGLRWASWAWFRGLGLV